MIKDSRMTSLDSLSIENMNYITLYDSCDFNEVIDDIEYLNEEDNQFESFRVENEDEDFPF